MATKNDFNSDGTQKGYDNIKRNKELIKTLFDTPEHKIYQEKKKKTQKRKERTYKFTSLGGSGKAVQFLIFSNVLIYILGFIVGTPFLFSHFAGFPMFSPFFRIWQPVTSMFLHGGFLHIAFNMFVLWQFGKYLEELWGTKKFLIFYIIAGVFSGILCSLLSIAPAVGASGAICGLLAAYAFLEPDAKILLFFFIPAKIKPCVIWFGILSAVFGILSIFDPALGFGIANFGHLGGLLAGAAISYFWLKKDILRNYNRLV